MKKLAENPKIDLFSKFLNIFQKETDRGASIFAASPYPGEGSREILVKVGSVIDDIESATEALESLADSIDDSLGSLCCFPTLISSVPYSITTPGTYLVTQDLHVAGGFFGIEILSDDVVLNLCGKK